jgi:hypothetical protein
MMKIPTIALAAGLLVLGSAYAEDQGGTSSTGADQQHSQGSAAQDAGSGAADDRTTQGDEPGAGVRHGSNEGGTGREPTAEQPSAAPGTGDTSEPNRGAGVGDAGSGSQSGAPDTGDTADQSSTGQQSGQGSSGSTGDN